MKNERSSLAIPNQANTKVSHTENQSS
jgi:hypothetical protein